MKCATCDTLITRGKYCKPCAAVRKKEQGKKAWAKYKKNLKPEPVPDSAPSTKTHCEICGHKLSMATDKHGVRYSKDNKCMRHDQYFAPLHGLNKVMI